MTRTAWHIIVSIFFGFIGSYAHSAELVEESVEESLSVIPPALENLPYGVYRDNPADELEYNTLRLIFNKRFQYFPKAIFVPTTYAEVQYLISVMKTYCLRFAMRSGGHCHEPGSLSPDYIIDTSKFKDIIIDIPQNKVFIGAGALLGNVINTLGATNHAIPTGTCPTVGVSGLALGGGIGLLCRAVGLTCDAVKSITMINANAEIIEVNDVEHQDLFWALRGAGNGSYGIVLGWTFNLSYIPNATFYELLWEFDLQLVEPLINTWQEWIPTLPPTISSVLAIRHEDDRVANPESEFPFVIRIFGLKIGSEPFTEWQKAFRKCNPKVFTASGGYGELSRYWASETSLPFNKCKSCILCEPLEDNTINLITHFFEGIERRDPNLLVYFELEAFGGAMAQRDTAFFPRKAFGWWLQAYYWPLQSENAEILALSRDFYSEIPKEVRRHCYANIVDYDLGPSYLEKYYGDHVDRLERIKQDNDPSDLFHWRQSIPLPQDNQ